MNKPITLCDRCDMQARCLLNFDGIPCRKNRTVEPTNADRIRAMTDEELARLLDQVDSRHCNFTMGAKDCQESCENCWLDWLKATVEVDNG